MKRPMISPQWAPYELLMSGYTEDLWADDLRYSDQLATQPVPGILHHHQGRHTSC